MKAIYNILILFTLISISITSYSQNNFNFIYGSNEWSEIPSEAVEDEQGNIFIVGYKSVQDNFPPYSSFIIKLSPEGLLLNEKSFSLADSSLKLSGIILLDDSIYLFGTKGPINIGIENCICGYILDNDLIVRSNVCYKTYAGDVQIYSQPIVYANDHFTISMNVFQAWDAPADIGFYKLNRNLDSVLCKIEFQEGSQLAYDFIYSPVQNIYKVFGTAYPGTIPSYSELLKFDSNFNYLGADTIPWQLVNQFSVKQFEDSTYLLTGKKSNYNPTKMNIGLIKVNEFDQMLWNGQFGKEGDTVNYPGVSNGIDFIFKDAIYLGGTSNIIPLHYPWQSEDSWLMLNQLDSNLNIKWQSFYGGDAFYHLRGLKATNDGGCLIYATRYDENTQDQEFDIYLLKVDSLGLMTSTSDNFTIPAQQLSIVPNPANQYVSIRYPDIFGNEEKKIVLYNSLGIPVKIIDATQESSGIRTDVSALPAGLYFVVLQVNGKKTGTGKLVVL